MSKQENAENLMREGHRLLDEWEPDEAIEIGKKLKKLRHSSAFEILALAYAQKDQIARAIKILQEGTKKAPDVWMLWQLLGNYYSDEKRFSDCQDAYRRALQCPQVNADSVHLNLAIALEREEKYREAIEFLDLVSPDHPEAFLRAQVARIGNLNRTKRHGEALECAKKLEERGFPEDFPDEQLAAFHSEYGEAIWEVKRDRSTALDHAWKALNFRRGEPLALWLIREIEGKFSASSKYFRITVEGEWEGAIGDDPELQGFFTTFDVVAESAGEAFEMVKPFEPPAIRDKLRIESCEELEAHPGDPIGVYRVTGRAFFPLNKEE